jgi:vacuole morphology and inheritance protein 14
MQYMQNLKDIKRVLYSFLVSDLRLQLLEWEENDALIYALYGLLMILPQSEAYATLQRRLAAIPPATKPIPKSEKSQKKTDTYCPFDFSELLKHFHVVQEQHKEHKRKQRLNSLVERNASHIDV